MRIEVISPYGKDIINRAEMMKVKGGIYRLSIESKYNKIKPVSYCFDDDCSINFCAGIWTFVIQIEGLPQGDYIFLMDEEDNCFYFIDQRKFNDNNPKKAVWTNGA